MFRANDQISLHILDQSCLGLAAGEGPLGQDTDTLHCIVMSPPGTLVDNVDIHGDECMVAVYNSVQCPVMTCVHIAETGGECSWSGSEYWRGETLTVTRPGHTPSSLPQIRSYD